jgi:hypothetical protein
VRAPGAKERQLGRKDLVNFGLGDAGEKRRYYQQQKKRSFDCEREAKGSSAAAASRRRCIRVTFDQTAAKRQVRPGLFWAGISFSSALHGHSSVPPTLAIAAVRTGFCRDNEERALV